MIELNGMNNLGKLKKRNNRKFQTGLAFQFHLTIKKMYLFNTDSALSGQSQLYLLLIIVANFLSANRDQKSLSELKKEKR